jgi:hypothetical protein
MVMVDLMKQAIEALKAKVNSNLEEIKNNEILFRKIFSEGKVKDCADDMNKILEYNKKLLAENFDFINVQLSLLKFLEKYKLQEVFNEPRQEETNTNAEEPEQINYFELTISGKLHYNEEHPMFYNVAFFNNLMSYFESHENYEKCAELLKVKNSSKN